MEDLKKELLEEINEKISDDEYKEIEELLIEGKHRQVFYKLNELKKNNRISSPKFMGLLEKFWWTYAN